MAVTTSFDWVHTTANPLQVNTGITGGSQRLYSAAASADRSTYTVTWVTDEPGAQFPVPDWSLAKVIQDIGGTPTYLSASDIQVNGTHTQQNQPIAVPLSNGGFVVAYRDYGVVSGNGGDITGQIIGATGSVSGSVFKVVDDDDDLNPSGAMLADGSTVFAYETLAGVIEGKHFTGLANGAFAFDTFQVATGNPNQNTHPAVAGLTGGGFVVAWDSSADTVSFRRYDSHAVALDPSRVEIQFFGDSSDVHVVGLADGGFAVSYTNNAGLGGGKDVAFRIYNADGSLRSGSNFIRANEAAGGDQESSSITTLDNGMIAVSWISAGQQFVQVFDAQGNRIGHNDVITGAAVTVQNIVGLRDGRIAAQTNGGEEFPGSGDSVATWISAFTRTFTSDGASDTMVGINDGLKEIFFGNGGADIIIGGTGADEMHGGSGVDTASYATASAGVVANLADPSSNTGDAKGDTYDSIENLIGSAFSDRLTGDENVNSISGGAGGDILKGGAGDDKLDGGADTDFAIFSGPRSAYKVSFAGDGVHVVGPDGNDLLTNIEFLVFDDATSPAPGPTHWQASVDLGAHNPAWKPVATGNFDGNGTRDLVFHNPTNGNVDIWKIAGGNWAGSINLGPHATGWNLAGTGDFDGQNGSDIAWFNPTTSQVELWRVTDGHWSQSVDLGTHAAGATPAAIGDFSGDGTSDILWSDSSTGAVDLWRMSNNQVAEKISLGTHTAGASPVAVGDFNGDGTADVVWYNATSGATDIWTFSGGHVSSTKSLGTHATGWTPAGAGDVTGDGTDDVVWFNPTTGETELWRISNANWDGSISLGTHPTGWTVAAVGDVNADGVADITWSQTSTGHVENWLLTNI